MKKEKIEELKIKLEKERENVEEMISEFAKESDSIPGDWNTRFPNFKAEGTLDEEADEVEEYSSLLPIERTLETKLQNINAALEKIKRGNYGKCEVCGNDISEERLGLIPETKTCGKCKE
ncbi:MAG: TraR/DksA C4-type zinc finger protein [Minisyncoccales bacterium]|jgi:RNA polymerase-binding transcription factor DksA